jgi:hypothetical protein
VQKKRSADTTTMLKRVAEAIAEADGGDMQEDAAVSPTSQAALRPLAKPTNTMIEAMTRRESGPMVLTTAGAIIVVVATAYSAWLTSIVFGWWIA